MSLNAYEVAADGSEWDEVAVNQMTAALGRINNVSINPMKAADYIIWRVSDTYYAQNGRTGLVTSNAACHTLVNGLLATNKSYYFTGDNTYVLTGAINLGSYYAVSIFGNPKQGTVFQPADTINAFEFDENWYCVLKDFRIDGVNQTTSGMGLKFTEATGTLYACRNRIENIEFQNHYIGIGDANAGTNGAHTNQFKDLKFTDGTYTDIRLNVNGTGYWWFIRCIFDHWAGKASDNYTFLMTGADGLVMDLCSWLMGGATSKGGANIQDTDFIWMSNCDMEQAGLSGYVFRNCTYGQINNLRMHQAAMDGGATGESNLALLAVRDFSFDNTTLNISTGATNPLIHILQYDGTESDHITFHGGHITNGGGYGVAISDATSNTKLLGMNLYGNGNDDIFEEDTTNYNTYKGNNMNSGNGWTLIGAKNTYDQFIFSTELDLSGAATDVATFFAPTDCVLAGYRIIYTEASSGDVGVDVRVGKYRVGVAIDVDYFDVSTSSVNKGLGYEDFFDTSVLLAQDMVAGDIVTVGTGGNKVGTGNVRFVLSIIENAS